MTASLSHDPVLIIGEITVHGKEIRKDPYEGRRKDKRNTIHSQLIRHNPNPDKPKQEPGNCQGAKSAKKIIVAKDAERNLMKGHDRLRPFSVP